MQHILWRQSSTESVRHYRLKTVTYGTSSSAPFLGTRCLQKIAEDNFEQFPEAAESIRSEFYMDDWLSGGYSLRHALTQHRNVHSLLAKSHFLLVKYASNSKELLAAIDNQLVGALQSAEFNSCDIISILGLKWLPDGDMLSVKINFDLDRRKFNTLTRITTLSAVSKIFDPLGILAPVTITGKIIVQEIWRQEIGWDEPISTQLQVKVTTYFKSLSVLNEYNLNRCCNTQYFDSKRQLIGFSDASEHAYAAVLYLRLIHASNQMTSIMNGSKPRLLPSKP